MIAQPKSEKSEVEQKEALALDSRGMRILYYSWGSYGVLGYLLFFAAWLWPESMRWAQAAIDWFMPWLGSLKGAALVNHHPLAAQVVLLYSCLMIAPLLLLTLWLHFGSRLRCQRTWYVFEFHTMSWKQLGSFLNAALLGGLGGFLYVCLDNPRGWLLWSSIFVVKDSFLCCF